MIQLLSEETIRKIAAGEVIERPASIVKELVENSIDAGSTTIRVEIKDGGKTLIRVSDNGEGIDSNQINMAFMPHSTSKLVNFNDLFVNKSLGFRGEALSSIVAVTKLNIKTKTNSVKTGTSVDFINNEPLNRKKVAMNKGTIITVSDLFHNVPVRKKFMNKEATEANRITNLMYKLAIGHPNIGFQYIKDERIIFETKENSTLKETLLILFGRELYDNLHPLNIVTNEFKIHGYISLNQYYRANRGMQYLYINNRYIENRSIRDHIEKQFTSVIPNGRYPVYQLFIDIDPSQVDVNIHPNKEKVHLKPLEAIIKEIVNCIQNMIQKKIEYTKATSDEENVKNDKILYRTNHRYQNLLKQYSDSINRGDYIREDTSPNKRIDYQVQLDNHLSNINKKEKDLYQRKENNIENHEKSNPLLDEIREESFFSNNRSLMEKQYIGQVFSTYLIFESKDRLYLLDQHAAHERILFEQYKKDFENENIHRQQVLHSEVIELSAREMEIFENQQDKLQNLGFTIDIFSERSVIIREVPMMLGEAVDYTLFLDLLDTIESNPENSFTKAKEKIIQYSCKHAIKAGDRLDEKEIHQLIEDLESTEFPYTCPHGRPTILEIEKKDIEKLFMRIK